MSGRHTGEIEWMDYSGEFATIKFYFQALTPLNLPTFLTQYDIMLIALQGITLGQITWTNWVGDETILSNVPPTNSAATRKLYWEMEYEGNASKRKSYIQIGTADTSKASFFSDYADLSQPQIAAFITAFEDIARSPYNSLDNVTVTKMRIKGRKFRRNP